MTSYERLIQVVWDSMYNTVNGNSSNTINKCKTEYFTTLLPTPSDE